MQELILRKAILLIILCSISDLCAMKNQKSDELMFDLGALTNLVPELINIIVNQLEDPITFGKTNKTNYSAITQLGRRNLIEIYTNQNPLFLHNHYVPILFIETRLIDVLNRSFCFYNPDRERGKEERMYSEGIDPYKADFYVKSKKAHKDIDCKQIAAIKQKFVKQYIDQEKIRYNIPINEKKIRCNASNIFYMSCTTSQALTKCLLFSENAAQVIDILNKCKHFNQEYFDKKIDFWKYHDFHNEYLIALLTLMKHSFYDNNALELLLRAEKKCVTPNLANSGKSSFNNSYYANLMVRLLFHAQEVKNKKALIALLRINPYCIFYSVPLNKWYGTTAPADTLLDLLIKNNFDAETIAACRKYGGKTTQELKKKKSSCVIL